MAEGGPEDSKFLEITGKAASKTLKKKSKNKTTYKTSNDHESLLQEVKQTIEIICNRDMEIDDRKKLTDDVRKKITERASELLSLQSDVIECLEKKIQELKAKIRTLEKSEQELKKQLIKAQNDGKNGSVDDQEDFEKLREQIDELKNTIAEKDRELQKTEEIKLNLSAHFDRITKEMAIMKHDLSKKHEEDMAAMQTELTKQNEEVLEQVKRLENMLSNISKHISQEDHGQDKGRGSQQNKPTNAKPSGQQRPTKSGPKPKWRSNFKKSD
ncbi:centrosomal protein of 63 kDa-like [Ruditapes philippinarum]|uniref:centrosomal protein of 63 kDa-like n=1 Tax=Ruditapes philippinarum TaxID=129788 RepID=UPI00295B26F7|nr:centrosomal protein of 63 kDa-like [Ruditapes philippinarum]